MAADTFASTFIVVAGVLGLAYAVLQTWLVARVRYAAWISRHASWKA